MRSPGGAQRLTASDRQSSRNFSRDLYRIGVLNALRHLIGNQHPDFQLVDLKSTVLNALRHLIGNQDLGFRQEPDRQPVLNALRHLIGNQREIIGEVY